MSGRSVRQDERVARPLRPDERAALDALSWLKGLD
jgi:hypothetical protein